MAKAEVIEEPEDGSSAHGRALLDLYDHALPEVHGYLVRRCRSRIVAEELTAETFLAAVASAKAGKVDNVTVPWLVGIARHKLVDHWRRQERDERRLQAVAGQLAEPTDGWETVIDSHVAHEVLAQLSPAQRGALTLRYLDGLPVVEVARHLDRTLQATEALLTRSKAAFRRTYARHGEPSGGDHV